MQDRYIRDSRKLILLTRVLQDTALEMCLNFIRQGKSLQSIWSSLNAFYDDPLKIDELLIKQIEFKFKFTI